MRRLAPLLVRFTDEELMLFSADHPVVDAPYLSGLDETQRELAAQIAYRSLCAHGAVAVDGGKGMELPESVVTMLQVRASATSALLISKATAEVGVLRYHHLGRDVVVIEDVTDDGIHEFRLIEPEKLPDEVDAFCTVQGAADGQGEPVTLTVEAFAAGDLARELWGEGVAQFDATVWRAAPDPARGQVLLGVLLGTDGSWSSRRLLVPNEGGDSLIEMQPARAAEVGDFILGELLGAEGGDVTSDTWHLMRA
ncbi:hypothetical protein [Flexivirga alba]|uniref:Uncharacterized protein n=1 Tax=Flexivirga alba TaxID=702742 RepID=A0ABW2ALC2_9MICO